MGYNRWTVMLDRVLARDRIGRSLVAVIMLAALMVLAPMWIAEARFELRTSESKVLGKTPSQVILIAGAPDGHNYDNGGSVSALRYDGPMTEKCKILFEGGVAVRVVRWSK